MSFLNVDIIVIIFPAFLSVHVDSTLLSYLNVPLFAWYNATLFLYWSYFTAIQHTAFHVATL